jgi:hypothetical protein
VDEDRGDAKEGEVERNRQCGMAVYLYWGGLQPVPIAKPDGQNVTRGFDKPARSIEKPKPLPYHSAKTQNENEKTSKTKFFNKLLIVHSLQECIGDLTLILVRLSP